MEFILGCNYWASHAGAEMWTDWNAEVVEHDLKLLSQNGVRYLRVFPNWRDFQPVMPLYTEKGGFYEFRLEGGRLPDNPYYVENVMMERFTILCDLASRYQIRLIVGLLTGWMSGRLFLPSALYGKNLFTDPTALLFEQKFIRGFVSCLKNHPAIYAWDLGNECNCMSTVTSPEEAENWTSIISNAIRSSDPGRPIISGMHSLTLEENFTIRGQAENTDMLTTHPYPLWVPHCSKDPMISIRTLLHATAETTLYSSVGHKPCLVEEIGTMGPMICNDAAAADFMRVNLFSCWAAGSPGLMWWCAHEQTQLTTAPYSWNMCERELGLLTVKKEPKPAIAEMDRFGRWLTDSGLSLPDSEKDAVCLLTKGQDHWGIAYMTYILAVQAGLRITFHDAREPLPDASVYLMPSVSGTLVMPLERYQELKARVAEGSLLYISNQDAFLTEFEELTGLQITDSCFPDSGDTMLLDGFPLPIRQKKQLRLNAAGAEVLACDSSQMPVLSANRYHKGTVYFLNFPLEQMLLEKSNAFDCSYELIYKKIFGRVLDGHLVRSECPFIGITVHHGARTFAVLVNYSDNGHETALTLQKGCRIHKVLYGSPDFIPRCDALVLELELTGNHEG